MQDKVTYEFSVIRVVPKVEREEFLNVGVILFSKRKKFLGIKYRLDTARLRAFSPDLDLELLQEHLQVWEQIAQGNPDGGPIAAQDQAFRFRWLAAPKSTILQCSRPHPGLCDDPPQLLDRLFEFYVG